MTTITVTPELRRQLLDFSQPLEFRDEQGELLGFLDPAQRKPTYEELMASCPYTEEELRERARNFKDSGRTTEDILRELREKWPIE